jgi:hypothetical protein
MIKEELPPRVDQKARPSGFERKKKKGGGGRSKGTNEEGKKGRSRKNPTMRPFFSLSRFDPHQIHFFSSPLTSSIHSINRIFLRSRKSRASYRQRDLKDERATGLSFQKKEKRGSIETFSLFRIFLLLERRSHSRHFFFSSALSELSRRWNQRFPTMGGLPPSSATETCGPCSSKGLTGDGE